MRPVIAQFDDFFAAPEEWRADLLKRGFSDYVSEWDGVTYPGICKEIMDDEREWLECRLSDMLEEQVSIVTVFGRVTHKGLKGAPNRIHSDGSMAQYSAHIYLSEEWPAHSGTAFWHYADDHSAKHTDCKYLAEALGSSQDVSQWRHRFTFGGKFNSILIHDAALWHSAEPFGGWGDSAETGRLVLTCFFNIVT